MRKDLAVIFVVSLIMLPIAVFGCKGKIEKEGESMNVEMAETTVPTEEVVVTQAPVTEPAQAQTVMQEAIPPTASVPVSQGPTVRQTSIDMLARNRDIQSALKSANFYTGNIDGKIGPKTKKAIIEFQKAKSLKADGKVGPRTWAELEKYLKQ